MSTARLYYLFVTYNSGIYICIYIYKVSYIHSFFVIFNCNVFSALHAKHFEIFWVLRVTPFSLLCSIFFLSRKLCFLRSPCLLLIAESISLDTSGKPTVGFFLKISSSSWIILSISLDELNSSDWLLKSWWWIFLK